MDRAGTTVRLDRAVRGGILGIATLATALTVGVTVGGPAHAESSPQIAGSPAGPSASEISPVCTTSTPSTVLGPATSVPSNPVTKLVTPAGGVAGFSATATNLYVDTGTHLVTYTLSGLQVASFTLPANVSGGNEVSQPVVDPSGNIYLSSYYGTAVDKFSPTGALLWSVDPQNGNPTGLFSVGSGAGWQLVVSVIQSSGASQVLSPATGSITGTFPLVDGKGDFVTSETGGNLLLSANGYVETVSPTGRVLSTFGAPNIEGNGQHTGSGTQFYYPGQAVQGPDGTIYTADPLSTIEATSPNGFLLGATTLGGSLAFGGWGFALVGSTFYLQSGPPFNNGADAISTFSLAGVQSYLAASQRPSNSLGWGAGLSTPATGNYFAPGTTPTVAATFDPWWAAVASNLQLNYTVENSAALSNETMPAPNAVSLPTTPGALADIALALPAADTAPGPYQVQATLVDTATNPPTTLGTTCMPYTVGAAGDGLNFSTLPAGAGSGGPSDPRGVALNSQLGLDSTRSVQTVNWGQLLPNCNAGAPSAATCGPSAMTFASASTDPYKAAFLAVQDHVNYWIQVSGGDAVSMALVNGGYWQGDIAALVTHYATVPVGCANCAPVTMWEPWNESNNTGWANGATYATSVLHPFFTAVKSVEPGASSTVIGGSTLEPVVSWWRQLITAGGLSWMDVAAIHPYTGSNDSYEEDGMPAQVQALQGVLGGKPLWFTEIGWWSDGDYNFLSQANNVARSLIWEKSLGVSAQNYFFDEGSWGNNGISFSLIQATSSVDYVKPAALATMTTSQILAGRPYLSMPATGMPQAYRADFGATAGGSTKVSAVWTDGLAEQASVVLSSPTGSTVPVTVTSEYGATTTSQATSGTAYSLPVSDQVSFITYPAGDTLAVRPTETFGTDLASASAHGTASATSGNASAAIAGLTVGYGQGWTSGPGDVVPALTVTLAAASTLDRVVVDTQSVGSTATSIRNYTLSANEPGTGWVAIATQTAEYRNHEALLTFAPLVASQLRVSVTEVNFGGYFGGGIPPWWSPTSPAPAFLHAVQAYAGSGGPSVVDGSTLPALLGGSSGGGTGGGTTTTTTTTVPPTTTTTTVPPTTTTTTVPPTTTTTTTTLPPTNGGGNQNWRNKFKGYWLTTSNGGIFSFGQATTLGSPVGFSLNKPIVDMVSTPDKLGYWMVASDGGIFTFGDAGFYGSTGGLTLNKPIVGMATTPDGLGYWLVASDGGIFAFGDAGFFGSTGALTLNKPIVGMDTTPDGQGYWLAASDGGIFAFGDAGFFGSTGAMHINAPVTGIQSSSTGAGYWLVSEDGGIFSFGDAKYYGSAGNLQLQASTISISQ